MIGILGGMGPKSTGPFIDNVVEQCQKIYGATYDIDFPHMMIYSCPTPFYIDRPINHEEMAKTIINGAKKLETTGVDFIAIPCNTAHLYFSKLKESISVPILNMIDETIKEIPINTRKVALLATAPTIQSGLYEQTFSLNDVEYVHKNSWQTCVNQIISAVKSGEISDGAQLWSKLCWELNEAVDTAILACTDLNIVSHQIPNDNNITIVDSSDCLARAVVNKYLSLSNPS
ncbi:aspartate/glutamate racemase family protein [Cytobacillus sp. IB215665]|uniref:aspartate/glutamate racemase family protein n=1 Tax=Cytobacillus sp. IB215665 TaxID=3097357 RepID=UPI002A0E81DC|nr:amino acid racemase [Cytobacillus sp. IB215665]MDX8365570.1 amino acid racemase [Cytobacillus sp. IB215665]